jgi:hypothetical protein
MLTPWSPYGLDGALVGLHVIGMPHLDTARITRRENPPGVHRHRRHTPVSRRNPARYSGLVRLCKSHRERTDTFGGPAADRNPATFADVPGGLALTSCLRCGAVVAVDRTVYHDEWHAQVGAYRAAPLTPGQGRSFAPGENGRPGVLVVTTRSGSSSLA